MTLKSSSSGKGGSLMQREYLKRRLWTVGLVFTLFFLYFVLGALLGFLGIQSDYTPQDRLTLQQQLIQLYGSLLKDGFSFSIAAISGVVLALQGFEWLHDRRAVDFYESQPVARKAHFWGISLNSLCIYLGSYIAAFVPGLLMAAAFGAVNRDILVNGALFAFARDLTCFAASYAFGTLAAVLTGNAVVSVLAVGVFFGYEFLLRTGIVLLKSLSFNSFADNGNYAGMNALQLNPLVNALKDGIPERVLRNLILTVPVLLIARFAYEKRPNESAGSAVVFAPVRSIVKVAIAVLGGILTAVVFWDTGGVGTNVFAGLVMAVIVCCVMEIIYHYNFRKLFARLPEMLVALAITTAVIVSFRLDLFGYDRWVPKASAIESSAIWHTGIAELDEDGKWIGTNDFVEKYMKLIDSETVVKLAESCRDAAIADDWKNSGRDGVTFLYRMKNGREVLRRYPMNREASELINAVTDSEEYRTGMSQIWHDAFMDGSREVRFRYCPAGEDGEEARTRDYQTFRTAYRRDLSRWSYDYALEHRVIGSIDVELIDESGYIFTLPLYEGYDETISFLKALGIYKESRVMDPDRITAAEVRLVTYKNPDDPEEVSANGLEWDRMEGGIKKEYTDPDRIREILDAALINDGYNLDDLILGLRDYNCIVTVTFQESAYDEEAVQLVFKEGECPAFIKADFAKYWYDADD